MRLAYDTNGNKVLKVEAKDTLGNARGFSVQTLGNLPSTHRDGITAKTISELKVYVKAYGTAKQKASIDTLITRQEYLANSDAMHVHYYKQFITESTVTFIKMHFPVEVLLKSKDGHFNDLESMHNNSWAWACTPVYLGLARKAGEVGINSLGSQSFHTCVGKTCARLIVKEHKQ